MALKFPCADCGEEILVKYLKPGETAECKNCGHLNIVPSDAGTSNAEPDYERKVPFAKWETLDLPSLEGVAGAGFWIRALARLIDIVIHNIVMFISISVVTGVAFGAAAATGRPIAISIETIAETSLLEFALALTGYAIYHAICEGFHGATVGKLICGLVVLQEDGSPCSPAAAFGRSLFFYIDSLFWGAIAWICMRKTALRQRCGDEALHTMVLRRKHVDPSQHQLRGHFAEAFMAAVLVDGSILAFSRLLTLWMSSPESIQVPGAAVLRRIVETGLVG